MLIKHQSFEISQRKKSHNRDRSENLYEAKKCPYLKFILIPGIIGFMLLCILVNVDFASEVEKTRENDTTTVGVVDNANITANFTEFWEDVNALESSEKIMESKQDILVVHENRDATFKEMNSQQQRSKEILRDKEAMKVLPSEFVKAFDEEVNVNLKPAKEAETFKTQELKRNVNGIRIILDISPNTENLVNKYNKPQIFNTKFEINYKEFNYKTPPTQNLENILDISAHGKVGKIVDANSNPAFLVVDKEPLAAENIVSKVINFLTADKELLSMKDAKSKITHTKGVPSFPLVAKEQQRPFADLFPSEVGNPRSTLFRTSKTLKDFRVAKLSKQQEYKQSHKKNKHEIDIAITILQNITSENVNEISQEVGNTIKSREFEEAGSYEQTYITHVKVNNESVEILETEQNAGKAASLIGNAKNLNVKLDTKDKSNGLKNGDNNKSVESKTNFVLEENLNAKQLSREFHNDVQFPERQGISKDLSVSKLPGSLKNGQVNTADKTLNQDMLEELTKTLKKPTQEAIGNAVLQYGTKTRGQYYEDFLKSYVSQREEHVSDTNPLEPELSKVKEVPRAVANHSPESASKLCKIFKETPNYKFINNLKNAFNITQIVGSAVPDLPTKLKIKEAPQHSRTKMYNPNETKHSEKYTQIQNEIPPPKVGNTLGQLTQYSETKNNNTETDSSQLPDPFKWLKRHLANNNKTLAKNKHLPWENNTALEAGNTIRDILEQPEQYQRNPRQVESDNKLDYATNAAIAAMKCTRFRDNCTLKCDNGGVSHLGDDLEDLQSMCYNGDLTLEIRNCVFVDGIMKTNFLNGFYSLHEFQIINCTLTSIQDGAFKQRGVKNLHTLKFINNSIELLTATTFDGLTVLKHFEFSQHVEGDKSIGDSFLTPMAATLTNVKIMLTHENNAIVDPSSWLQGPDFVALYIVDLENNNLQGVLNTETFKSLTALGTLNLQNCSLHTIDIKPFEVVVDTLYNLYLNNNYLITLNPMFLDQLLDHQIILSAKGNRWQCDCEHSAMIDYMKYQNDNQYINMEDFCCEDPEEWNHINMVNVTLSCQAETTTMDTSVESDTTPTQSTKETETSSTSTTSTTSTTTVATSPTTASLDTTLADTTTDLETSPPTDSFDTTTPTDTNVTSNLEKITCRSHDSTDLFTISLRTRTADLTIKSSTSTSVIIVSSIDSASFRITYFLKYNQHSTVEPTSMTEWTIHNLIEKQSYMFCLVQDSDDTVSPFDCWGHFMDHSAVGDWLLTSDKDWVVSVVVIAALVFCITAGAAVYFVLRQRPSWVLTYSERVLRVHQSSHKIVLLPKGSSTIRRVSSTSQQSSHQTRRASYLSPTTPCGSNAPSPLYASLHKPPTECAPTLPGGVKRNSYSSLCNTPQSGVHLNKVTGQLRWLHYTEENNYGYNTIDHYEEIKF